MNQVGVNAIALGCSADNLLERSLLAQRLGQRLENLFRLNSHNIVHRHLGDAPFQVEAILVAQNFVAGYIQARATAQDHVIGMRGNGRSKEGRRGQTRQEAVSYCHSAAVSSAKRSIAAATPSSSLEPVIAQPRVFSSGTLLPITTGTPAKDNISRSL